MNPQDTVITAHPGKIPSTPIIWPADKHTANKIQQMRGSAKPQTADVLPTTQPNASAVAPRTTPAPVSDVRVVRQPGPPGSHQLTVQFTHPHGDAYFSGANVYLRRAGQQPVLVASGAKSPVTFTVPKHAAPHAIYVTSSGNWGETDVLTSPSHAVALK